MTHKEYRERANDLAYAASAYIDERRAMDTMLAESRWTDPAWLHSLTQVASKVQSLESQIRVHVAEVTSAPLKLKP